MHALLALVLAASFPLPTVDGKPIAVTADQKVFRLPVGFERVRQFYRDQFAQAPEVQLTERVVQGRRELTLKTRSKRESWQRAVVREDASGTVIDVTPVLRFGEEQITGTATPLVQFVFGRSPAVEQALDSIDHTEAIRRR